MVKQAVILAAGKGTRMANNATDPRLKNTPKPLLAVHGRPMIEEKIKRLAENGVESCVVINPSFKGIFHQKLKDYDIKYCYQAKPLGTANALYCSKNFVKEELFLVMMGDDIAEYDIEEVLRAKEPAVFGFEVDDVSGYGALMLNKNKEVERIVEKERSGNGFVNTGVYIMPREFFDYYDDIKPNAKGEVGLEDAPKVLSKHGIRFKLKEIRIWRGINTPADLLEANK